MQLDKEQAAINDLERQYKQALKDIEDRIKMLQADELTQSKIYQIQYQKALRGQVEGILDKLHGDEYATIQQYLHDSYQDGFIGTMYSVHGQGIPLILPIDQNAAVKAVITDSQIKEGLYNHIGVNIKQLKQAIRQEITRGLAANMPLADIARNISNRSKAPLSRAKTIVRTEGHRIQQASANDAREAAKANGCDVVKQWDGTLDSDTRPTHRRLDGQIRETNEPFEMDGKTAMYPGDFGKAEEDCNCRCVALTRAKWALDEDELKVLKERAKFFEVDKKDDFKTFEEKYLKAAETAETQPKPAESPKTLTNYKDTVEWAYDEMESNFELYRGLPEQYHAPFDTFEKETPKYEKQLSNAFKKFDFATNTDSNAIEKILRDGKLKGTIETHTSNGELDLDLRKRATGELFGLYDDVEELSASEFEKYGYLGTADRAKMYGNCRIVLKKENLWERTTFTVGDSLEAHVNGGYKTPTKVSDPKIISFSKDPFTPDQPDLNETVIKNIQKAFDSIEEHGYFKGVINNEDYVELQFHGAVTTDDIAYIEVPKGCDNLVEILDIAEEKGVKVKVVK